MQPVVLHVYSRRRFASQVSETYVFRRGNESVRESKSDQEMHLQVQVPAQFQEKMSASDDNSCAYDNYHDDHGCDDGSGYYDSASDNDLRGGNHYDAEIDDDAFGRDDAGNYDARAGNDDHGGVYYHGSDHDY